MSGARRPARPGELGDVDRADLAEFVAARCSRDWAALADRLVRLRARGVPVAVLSVVVGVGESRLRVVWVDTATAAGAVLGVSVARLLEHTVRAEADGVAVMAGWTRLWHGPSLPGWWAVQRVDSRTGARVRRDARAGGVCALVAGGATVVAAAAAVGMDQSSAYRYLRVGRRQG